MYKRQEVTGDQTEPAQEISEEIRTEDSGSGDAQTTEGQTPGNGDGEMQPPESQTPGNGAGEPQTDENKALADEGGEPLTEETWASERESETDAGSEGYENGRDVIEWTQDTGHLILELEKAVYMNKNQERFTAANKSGSIDPVSYTHLDVYKRQAQWFDSLQTFWDDIHRPGPLKNRHYSEDDRERSAKARLDGEDMATLAAHLKLEGGQSGCCLLYTSRCV